LRSARPILRRTRPIIRPRLISIRAQADHGLNGEARAGLGDTDGFVFRVVRHVGRAVEELVDAVAAVGFDDGAVTGFGMFFDGAAGLAEEHARFDEFDGFGEALAGSFDNADGFRVGEGFGADVVKFR